MDQPDFSVDQAKQMGIGHGAAEGAKDIDRSHINIHRITPFCNFIDEGDVSVKAPSVPVVVERVDSLIRLTFTPGIPVVPPVFLTVPFNDSLSAPTKNVHK
jgi:hypothetical protein